MLETIIPAYAGLLLLAGATHRLRADAGAPAERARRMMRLTGSALLVLAFAVTPEPLSGERMVRFLGGTSLAGIALVLLLSLRARVILAPVRWLVAR